MEPMTDYLNELLNMFISSGVCFLLTLYPMWKTRNVKSRFAYAYIICFYVLRSVTLLICGDSR